MILKQVFTKSNLSITSAKNIVSLMLALAIFFFVKPATALELADYPLIKNAVQPLLDDGVYTQSELDEIFASVSLRPVVAKKKANAAEKKLTWLGDDVREGGYRGIFLDQARIDAGAQFWHDNQQALNRAYRQFGVEPEIIAAILGVETKFGKIKGNHLVIESTATLANNGSKLQSRQLASFLRLVKAGELNLDAKGSYSGAIGYPQFISSSYTAYAIDFDGDNKRDLIGSVDDAIGSIANYFAEHKWRKGEPVLFNIEPTSDKIESLVSRKLKPIDTVAEIRKVSNGIPATYSATRAANVVKLLAGDNPPIYRATLHNFYVITRYNHSVLYGMAVYELSQEIKKQYQQSFAN